MKIPSYKSENNKSVTNSENNKSDIITSDLYIFFILFFFCCSSTPLPTPFVVLSTFYLQIYSVDLI